MSHTVPVRTVRPARDGDVEQTARLHQRGLPEGFFARIGRPFLRRYHDAFAQSPQATVLVAEDEAGRVRGMLVGTLDNAAHYTWAMRRQGLRLALAGVQGLLVRPRIAAEFLRTRVGRYGRAVARQLRSARAYKTGAGRRADDGRQTPSAAKTGNRPASQVAVLTHVTVSEDARGEGVGRRLVEAFLERAARAGADEVRLITDAGGPAARFYQSLGWRRRARRKASDGSDVEEYVRRL